MPRVQAINPSTLLKACKTTAEAEHIRKTMEQDGAALCEFFAWFEQAVNREAITELSIDEQITAARPPPRLCLAQLCHHCRLQCQWRAAPLPRHRTSPCQHCRQRPAADRLRRPVSRRHHRHHPRGGCRHAQPEQKRDFTLVLKGTLNLSMAHFPRGTLSPMLDALARAPMWQHDIDFGHGTGHGVGYFLNVHEGPQTISRSLPDASMAMQEGMITSVEPGIYRPGQWGVRIENLVLNVPAQKTALATSCALKR
jgi:Xaa-Pro aminopeptidase